MKIPIIRGVIDRRVLVNFRVDPDVLGRVCPSPFRPQIVKGFGIAGICLIRLKQIRPRFLPSFLGIGSENAAHRIAVEWDANGSHQTGVYIPRRDSSSLLNALAGGRIFPGVHNRARFAIEESQGNYRIEMESVDGSTHVLVDGTAVDNLPTDSVFASVKSVSEFFEAGSLGYSPSNKVGRYDGLQLKTFDWHIQPLAVTQVRSSFFDAPAMFPPGSVTFDNALLMRGIDHEWHSKSPLCCVNG